MLRERHEVSLQLAQAQTNSSQEQPALKMSPYREVPSGEASAWLLAGIGGLLALRVLSAAIFRYRNRHLPPWRK